MIYKKEMQDDLPEKTEVPAEDRKTYTRPSPKKKTPVKRPRKKRTKKQRKTINTILTVLMIVFLGVFAFSAYKVISWYVNSQKDKATNQGLRNEIVIVLDEEGNEVLSLTPYEKYQKLFDANEDMVGWIKIDGTHIDYPVMNTQYYPEKYIRKNFYGEYALGGTLFVGAGTSFDPRSDNVIIYGHNMTDDTMFHDLVNYKDPAYLNEHPTVHFDTKEEYGIYQIAFVMMSQVYTENDWEYYSFIDAYNADDFYRFVQGCKVHSLYNTGVDVVYGDQLLTLSTCEYSREDGRMIIVAKKVDSNYIQIQE